MLALMESNGKKAKDCKEDKSLDSQLWHACAGGMVKMPPVNSKVLYFPQGHSEHASAAVNLPNCPRIPPLILCQVTSMKFLADPETDEVYAKIGLVPVASGLGFDEEEDGLGSDEGEGGNAKQPASFAKTLTQSDANNGGGFSVPRYCAETIFPRLDYTADPPVQTILAKDVHGETWKFRHIYRGTPRRHLLTTGWSTFVNHKKLMAGDSIVFLRTANGDLCVGIRRAKRGISPDGSEMLSPGWGSGPDSYFSAFMREAEEGKLMRRRRSNGSENGRTNRSGRVRAESVVEASVLAASGNAFEVVYYPRASTPEFCVKAGAVRRAMGIRWCPGLRFKMAFETEDSSRISWFMGTVSSAHPADPIRWPNSPWRLLQVAWDEPELLQNVKRVSPWLVELVSNMPGALHFSPFLPPQKKPRLLLQPPEFPLNTAQFPVPKFSSNLFGSRNFLRCLPDNNNSDKNINIPAGMQGARHARFDLSRTDLHLHKQTLSGDPSILLPTRTTSLMGLSDNGVSCFLTMAYNNYPTAKKTITTPQLVLFGRPILTEQEISLGGSCGSMTLKDSSSDKNLDRTAKLLSLVELEEPEMTSLETGQCKVFMESEDVGRTLDLPLLGSYDALRENLRRMFGIEHPDTLNSLVYCDISGSVKPVGDEPYSEFARTARRLTIPVDSGNGREGI
ncbi:PREDICTED: auxin response factor 18-like [Tarenaya hassleriana]|uniref:auxin response factor 18-like n=1 Tax=Tarenaya hassleriana TaxID=28532 RepID=UPI00053C82D9|nr:PREDICTED: auxin response factor 18-like [Tarenaya hassleriana]XP_010543399.1 PREDICTED: auxin response factor 18-like [Tarenaya hassleriana]XP_010543400.1 PREDICTED: auxin response factor 18-like [Tarenaya hassleriana]